MLADDRKPLKMPASAFSRRTRRHAAGVVLPVVLVILVILTALVVTQVRRTTVDQRMASNAQESIALEAAAKAVLGWCEIELQRANRGWQCKHAAVDDRASQHGNGAMADGCELGRFFVHAGDRSRCSQQHHLCAMPD